MWKTPTIASMWLWGGYGGTCRGWIGEPNFGSIWRWLRRWKPIFGMHGGMFSYWEKCGVEQEVGESPKKVQRVLRKKTRGLCLVVDKDIRLYQILVYSWKTLTGRFLGLKMAQSTLNDWLQPMWASVIGYGPTFHYFLMVGSGCISLNSRRSNHDLQSF